MKRLFSPSRWWPSLHGDSGGEADPDTRAGETGLSGYFQLTRGEFSLDARFDVPGRGVTALFGHSGSGKTTLLRCIAGLERARRGEIRVNGECWQDSARDFFLPVHRRPIGYVFQEASLFPHLSVRRNLDYGMRRVVPARRRVALDEAVELLGIGPLLERRPAGLSGGERQRVAIARALLTSPRLLLMDEPLAALDALSKADILPYLEALHRELSIPVLYITHALPEVMRLADYVLLLEKGRPRAHGSLEEILSRLDLPLLQSEEAGTVVSARVAAHDDPYHLTYLSFCGGQLSLPRVHLAPGEKVRVRILSRDISISLDRDIRDSILNLVPARIIQIARGDKGQLLVRLDAEGCPLVARITHKSGVLLGLEEGMKVYARVKSMALV